MQSRTLVPCRYVGQAMRSLELKVFVNFHVRVLEIYSSQRVCLSARVASMLVFPLCEKRLHFTTKIKGF